MADKKFECYIDSISDGIARLLFDKSSKKSGGTSFYFPAELLPDGAADGTKLKISIALDIEGTLESHKTVEELYKKLSSR